MFEKSREILGIRPIPNEELARRIEEITSELEKAERIAEMPHEMLFDRAHSEGHAHSLRRRLKALQWVHDFRNEPVFDFTLLD